eukprot:Polyplicarium_translucidae@DN5541_c0_g1_i1.p1
MKIAGSSLPPPHLYRANLVFEESGLLSQEVLRGVAASHGVVSAKQRDESVEIVYDAHEVSSEQILEFFEDSGCMGTLFDCTPLVDEREFFTESLSERCTSLTEAGTLRAVEIPVRGLKCSTCALYAEKLIKDHPRVLDCEVSMLTERATITFFDDSTEDIVQQIMGALVSRQIGIDDSNDDFYAVSIPHVLCVDT